MPTTDHTHRQGIRLVPLGLSLSTFLAITFVLCVIGDLIPVLRGIHLLSAIYPDANWTRPELLITGTIWSFAAGWYITLVFGTLYNLFSGRRP